MLCGTVRISCTDKLDTGPGIIRAPSAAHGPGCCNPGTSTPRLVGPACSLHTWTTCTRLVRWADQLPSWISGPTLRPRGLPGLPPLPSVVEPSRPKEVSGSACDLPREVWHLETPQAEYFWCEGEPFPGPKVPLKLLLRELWAKDVPCPAQERPGCPSTFHKGSSLSAPSPGRWISWSNQCHILGNLGAH